ncbi:hypothetical protein BDY19DRAFT_902734 [Irpex rosettiformis]|uniref:Uncharacterized protein n=1 Tax=Irpex rosettiformis TaxID=378272 RepID=A0ACB8UIC5_9APHY|nr:hypothetical protein BDY19DRAFT_902734 [Irpex rosettiformis]
MTSICFNNCLPQGHARASPIIRTAAIVSSPDESSLNSPGRLAPSQARAPRRAMRCFVSRPFPPPALANVPVEYIIDQLHTLAPHYWSKPETADCSIIVPLDGLLRKTGQVPQSSGPVSDPFASLMAQSDGMSRASSPGHPATEPTLRPAPRMVMKLHMDYLSAHSTLLRSLLSGASPLDIIPSVASSPQTTPRDSFFHLPLPPLDSHRLSPKPSAARGLPIAPLLPRLLPSSPDHPMIYLPVPDPSSLRLLIHYMYFGSLTYIEDALDDGTASWEGMARNVEFLGMGMEIKICLGRWYGRWRRGREAGESSYAGADAEYDSDSDDDSYVDSDDEDVIMTSTSSATTASVGNLEDEDKLPIEDVLRSADLDMPARGRQRTTRRLGHAISDPGPIRSRGISSTAYGPLSSSPKPRI